MPNRCPHAGSRPQRPTAAAYDLVERPAAPARATQWVLLLVVVMCNGCTAYCDCRDWVRNGLKVGPNYCEPAAPVAEDWIDAADERVSSGYADAAEWWLGFHDPVLNGLVQSAYAQNLTLREAGMRVLEARAHRGVAVGSLFPQGQSINGEYARVQSSANLANPPPVRNFNDWLLTGDLLWELDFWGRFRRAVEAADANLDASVENYDDVLVFLVSEVAATYVNIRTLQQRLEYARANVAVQQGMFDIANAKFANGLVTEVDPQQARLVLTRTEALIPQLESALRQQNNLLCFLLGIPPRDLLPELKEGKIPAVPTSVAVGIPGELLRRRPDVRRAEREVAAQSAVIGIAVSDLYPHFTIRGSIGYEAANLSRLFMPTSNVGIIAPGFRWDVLNYGRFVNNIHAEEARFQQLALAYQNTVLRANQEVEDGLTRFLNSQEETLKLAESVQAADSATSLVTTQYDAGRADYNRVFILQDILVQQQDAFAASQGNNALSLIAVYRALGGGWQIRLGAGQGAADAGEEIPAVPVEQFPQSAEDDAIGPAFVRLPKLDG